MCTACRGKCICLFCFFFSLSLKAYENGRYNLDLSLRCTAFLSSFKHEPDGPDLFMCHSLHACIKLNTAGIRSDDYTIIKFPPQNSSRYWTNMQASVIFLFLSWWQTAEFSAWKHLERRCIGDIRWKWLCWRKQSQTPKQTDLWDMQFSLFQCFPCYLYALQSLWGHQAEGLHFLGHWHVCGWPGGKHHEEHAQSAPCVHTGPGEDPESKPYISLSGKS